MNLIDFEFDGVTLSSFGMLPYSGDSSSDGNIGNELSMGETRAGYSDRYIAAGSQYSDSFSTTIYICKNPCESEEFYLTDQLINQLVSWLNRKNYCKFRPIYDDGSFSDCYYMATFNVSAIMAGSNVEGLALKMITDSPYAYCDPVVLTGSMPCSLSDLSNELGPLYIDLELTLNEAGTLQVSNLTEPERKSIVENCKRGEKICFYGQLKQITSDNSAHTTLANDFNYIFPRLFKTNGADINRVMSSLGATYKLTYTPIRKVGLIV